MIEELYKKYYEELINWCHSMTGNLYTAEELVHEAFLRAMLHEDTLSTLKEQQSRSWLYRTVKNLYVDVYKRQGQMQLHNLLRLQVLGIWKRRTTMLCSCHIGYLTEKNSYQ